MRVLRSEDDTLFLVGGSNDVLRLYGESGFAELVQVEEWRHRIATRAAVFARMGIPWCQLLVPEKLSVMGDPVLARQVRGASPPGARLMRAIEHAELLYPLDYLRAQHRAGYVVYPRTDSHWTSLGALCAFQWIIRHFNTVVDYAPFLDTTPIPMSYRGDLWGDGYDAMPPDLLERRAVPPGIRRITANPIVRLKERERIENEADLHLGSHVAYVNDSAERPERVVLFGSSFSEYRAECSLLTFLATLFYREVHFVWSSSLDFGFIRRIKANLVIVEMPERFLTVCPSDTFDLADHEARVVATWESRHATATAGA